MKERTGPLADVTIIDCTMALAGPFGTAMLADLGDLALAERVARESWDALGGLDVVVNNAGIPTIDIIAENNPQYTREQLERAIDLEPHHLAGAQAAAPLPCPPLKAQRGPKAPVQWLPAGVREG